MLERIQSKRNTAPLLVEVQICTVILEISKAVSQKTGNQFTPRSSNTTLGHILKGCSIISQGHLFNHVHSSIISNCQNLKQPRCPSTEEWAEKMWYIYTVEYYSMVIKKMTSRNLQANRQNQKKIILREVTKTPKEKNGMFSYINQHKM